MTVRVTREAEPQIELYGAYTGELLGGALNTTARLTFTAADDYLIVVPKNDIRRPQLEDGPIPTSYIPTTTSTATRAGETLTIPNPPWPATVEATGTELVTNGTFDTDTDWTKYAGVTISGGVANATSAAQIVSQTVSGLSVGSVYQVTFDYNKTSGDKLRIENSTASGANILWTSASLSNGSGTLTALVAPNVGSVFAVAASGSAYSGSIDNISVKEITPRGLAIAMDGLVAGSNSAFANWALDANNGIQITSGASDFTFTQEAAGVVDSVTGGSYTSGINVPFSIASRHGDNFINGAVDGTALTANLTPTILPALSSTPIQIGSDFNGFIDTLRIWDVDLTDAGISEASS